MVMFQFILFALGRIQDLEYFTGKDIRIYLSAANHIFLAKDTMDGHILPKSKYSDLDSIFTAFKLHKDGQEYRLFAGEEMLCAEFGTLGRCENAKAWKIVAKTLGYTISQGGLCITITSRTRIGVIQCTDSDDQLFDFKLADEDQTCGEEKHKEPKQEPKTIVINVSTHMPAEKNVSRADNESNSNVLHHCNDSLDLHSIGHCPSSHCLSKMLDGSRIQQLAQEVVYL